MIEQFVGYDLSKKLKDIGFDENCVGFYTDTGKLKFNICGDEIKPIKNSQITVLNYCTVSMYHTIFTWMKEQHYLFYQTTFNNGIHGFKIFKTFNNEAIEIFNTKNGINYEYIIQIMIKSIKEKIIFITKEEYEESLRKAFKFGVSSGVGTVYYGPDTNHGIDEDLFIKKQKL